MQKSFPPKETATASKTATSQECQPRTQNDQNPTRGVNFQAVLTHRSFPSPGLIVARLGITTVSGCRVVVLRVARRPPTGAEKSYVVLMLR